MASPFPGMDPYLEGYLWPDVHHRLATEISRRLMPLLRPRYVARLEIYVVEDESPEAEIGITYPGVEVLDRNRESRSDDEAAGSVPTEESRVVRAPVTIPVLSAVDVRLASVEIRDVAHNELVTSIEILSPVNKREPGLTRYRRKRARYRAGVHLLEIDLLRRGSRPLDNHPRLPTADYLTTLTRARASETEVWPVAVRDALPAVPVPLRHPDPPVLLELGPALATIYDEAAYDLSIDYRQPPPPPVFAPEEERWLRGVVGDSRAGD